MNTSRGRGEVEALSWARIQPMGDGVQLTLRIAGQICSLRQILEQQAIGVLIGPALPGAVRICKEDLDGGPLGQTLVFGPLFAPVVGQRLAPRSRDVSKLFGEAHVGTARIRPSIRAKITRRVVRSTRVPTARAIPGPP